jgi:hypothetical protein
MRQAQPSCRSVRAAKRPARSAKRSRRAKRLKPHVTHNSGKIDWYTPTAELELVREVLGTIDLDVASSAAANKRVRAKRYFSLAADALGPRRRWRGRVFMNPPYRRDLCAAFVERLLAEYAAGHVTEAIVLTNNCTETEWGQKLVRMAAAVCFVSGRISFDDAAGGPSQSPLQGQMYCYLGRTPFRFLDVFRHRGVVVFARVPGWPAPALEVDRQLKAVAE